MYTEGSFDEAYANPHQRKPFKCDLWDYKCTQKGHLMKHMLTHTKEKPFKCDYCDFKCAVKSNWMQHMLTHTKEKDFKCDLCHYKSARKWYLIFLSLNQLVHLIPTVRGWWCTTRFLKLWMVPILSCTNCRWKIVFMLSELLQLVPWYQLHWPKWPTHSGEGNM